MSRCARARSRAVCARGPACTIDDEAANVPPKLTRPKPAA
eukprot:COSAG06_NODE_63756_length_261_cov_0.944444_1_plen_39_part_10